MATILQSPSISPTAIDAKSTGLVTVGGPPVVIARKIKYPSEFVLVWVKLPETIEPDIESDKLPGCVVGGEGNSVVAGQIIAPPEFPT